MMGNGVGGMVWCGEAVAGSVEMTSIGIDIDWVRACRLDYHWEFGCWYGISVRGNASFGFFGEELCRDCFRGGSSLMHFSTTSRFSAADNDCW